MEIYADVFFLVNFIEDFFLLSICARLIKNDVSLLRRALTALLSSALSFPFFYIDNEFASFAAKLAFTFLITLVCFLGLSAKNIFKAFFVLLILSNMLAGVVYAASFYLPGIVILKNGVCYSDISIFTLLLSTIICFVCFKIFEKVISKHKAVFSNLHTLTVFNNGRCVSLTALYDSGNSLYYPFSAIPVIIAERKSLSGLYKSEELTFVFASLLGGEKKKFDAFSPSGINIDNREYNKSVYIALSDTPLSSEKKFFALLHSEMLYERNETNEAFVKNQNI